MKNTALIAGLCLLLPACVINADKYPRPRDLTPAWKTPSLRILAIQAEPPEIQPGEDATFTALFADPEGEAGGTLWVACSPEETTPFGCAIDLSILSEDATPDDLADAGVIGFEPTFPPEWTAPQDALDSLDDQDRAEGLGFTVQATVLPPDGADPDAEFDFATFESGYKRIIVSEAPTPNDNPIIESFSVDGVLIGPDDTAEVDAGQSYELGVVIPDTTIQTYEYINPDGVLEERIEEPFVSWYATEGSAMEATTLYPFTQSDWTAPDLQEEVGFWYAVVRDRRGGVSWIVRQWRVRSAP
ncbi:MAG: hypothetical protein ACJAV2_000257 [Myxococcota bacterium]|jgi:hypothetical protein